jgi:hypothetical protein
LSNESNFRFGAIVKMPTRDLNSFLIEMHAHIFYSSGFRPVRKFGFEPLFEPLLPSRRLE